MKNRYSSSLLAVLACLALEQKITAHQIPKFDAIKARQLIEGLTEAVTTCEQKTANLCAEYLESTQGTYKPNMVKAGISKLIAALAAGYYLGMNHTEIKKGFDEQVRPAITLPSEMSLPTKAQAETFVNDSTKFLKDRLKKIALKNPDQTETKTEETSDQEKENS